MSLGSAFAEACRSSLIRETIVVKIYFPDYETPGNSISQDIFISYGSLILRTGIRYRNRRRWMHPWQQVFCSEGICVFLL